MKIVIDHRGVIQSNPEEPTTVTILGTIGPSQSQQYALPTSIGAGELASVVEDATVYVDPIGSDTTGDGTLANPWATVKHALDKAPLFRVRYLILCASGTLAPANTKWQCSTGQPTGDNWNGQAEVIIQGTPVDVVPPFLTPSDSDPDGFLIPTGVPTDNDDDYRGLCFNIIDSPNPDIIGLNFVRIARSYTDGVIRMTSPWGFVPSGTLMSLQRAGTIQPIAGGFGLFPVGRMSFGQGIQLQYPDDEGVFIEIFSSDLGTVSMNCEIKCSDESGFCGMGAFNCGLSFDGAWFIGSSSSFTVLGGNPNDWLRRVTYSGAVFTDFFQFNSPGFVGMEWTDFLRCSFIFEQSTHNGTNNAFRDVYGPLGLGSPLNLGINVNVSIDNDYRYFDVPFPCHVHDPVRLLSDSDVTLEGIPGFIDNVVPSEGDRVLLTSQTDSIENGIWIVQADPWIRPDDFSVGSHANGVFVTVDEGDVYGGTGWSCDTTVTDVVGTNELSFISVDHALLSRIDDAPDAGITISGNAKAEIRNLEGENGIGAVGIDVQRGMLIERDAALGIAGGSGELKVSGITYTHAESQDGGGIIDLSTLSSATPT